MNTKTADCWLTEVENMAKTEGTYAFSPVIHWRKANILSPELMSFKQSICEMASEIIAPLERQFLAKYPHTVSQELFLRSCAPFFEQEEVDWNAIETTIKSTVKQFYLTDISTFGEQMIQPLLKDVYFLLSAKDGDQLQGFLMCAVTPALPYGNVKVIQLGTKKPGLDKLLLASLFNILPNLRRLFLFARPTSHADINAYQYMGFTIDHNPFQDPNHKVNPDSLICLEYRTENADFLQNLRI